MPHAGGTGQMEYRKMHGNVSAAMKSVRTLLVGDALTLSENEGEEKVFVFADDMGVVAALKNGTALRINGLPPEVTHKFEVGVVCPVRVMHGNLELNADENKVVTLAELPLGVKASVTALA